MVQVDHNDQCYQWAGVGLRQPHYEIVLEKKPHLALVEVHGENFMMEGGPSWHVLEQIRQTYPLSLHGVGLSLGSPSAIDMNHLKKLKRLVDQFEPKWVSEHVSWGQLGQIHLNDLLPIPYHQASLQNIIDHVQQAQDYLKRPLLMENISYYLSYQSSDLSEPEFLNSLCHQSGCQLLLDINNVYVNAQHFLFDPQEWIKKINPAYVAQYHLAGFTNTPNGPIDTHASPISPEVWGLFKQTVSHLGVYPTIIERDQEIPEWNILYEEVTTAEKILCHHKKMGQK
jgi:uncharacterized protein (UPF0276 family)